MCASILTASMKGMAIGGKQQMGRVRQLIGGKRCGPDPMRIAGKMNP